MASAIVLHSFSLLTQFSPRRKEIKAVYTGERRRSSPAPQNRGKNSGQTSGEEGPGGRACSYRRKSDGPATSKTQASAHCEGKPPSLHAPMLISNSWIADSDSWSARFKPDTSTKPPS